MRHIRAGWAPEYVEAMWLILQQEKPDDYVIATGETHKLEDFVKMAFSALDLDWKDHVEFNSNLLRPTDLAVGKANPGKAKDKLCWSAQYKMQDVVKMMIYDEKNIQN